MCFEGRGSWTVSNIEGEKVAFVACDREVTDGPVEIGVGCASCFNGRNSKGTGKGCGQDEEGFREHYELVLSGFVKNSGIDDGNFNEMSSMQVQKVKASMTIDDDPKNVY